MAIELVTGHSGAAHVSGADAGAMHAGICGSDSYVLGAVPSVTMSDANTLVIQPCDLMVEGRHVRLSGTNTLSIRSGAQTGKRNDLVYVRYTYDSSTGTESAKLGVKEGTTATTATDPALDNPSSVLDGATIADVAIARVSLDALTPTATWLLPQLPTLKALGDSVSRKQTRLGNSITCYVEGGICILSADFLTLPYSNTNVRIGNLPDGLKPLGHTYVGQTGGEGTAYIGALRYRGNDKNFGQLMVTNSGSITAYTSVGGVENAYFYGQVVFPVTCS